MNDISQIIYNRYVVVSNFKLENDFNHITLIKVENSKIIDCLCLTDSKHISNEDKLKAQQFISDYLIISKDIELVKQIKETQNIIYPNFDFAWAEIRFENKLNQIRADIELKWQEYATQHSTINDFNYIYRGCYFAYEDIEIYNYICQNANL